MASLGSHYLARGMWVCVCVYRQIIFDYIVGNGMLEIEELRRRSVGNKEQWYLASEVMIIEQRSQQYLLKEMDKSKIFSTEWRILGNKWALKEKKETR